MAARDAVGVAAVDVTTAGGAGSVFNGTESVETFSSDGPRRIFFEADGTPITPGNFSSTGGRVLQKPDLAAADAVSTSTPGFSPFRGTSAAAPHAAAIAALMLEAAGGPDNVTLTALRAAMTGASLDIEATGVDRDSGAGLVMAPGAVDAVDVAVVDRNGVPTVSGTLDNRTMLRGADAVTVNVASEFSDPDNDTLTYNALSSDPDRVAVTRTGSQLTLTPGLPGLAVVTVRATDGGGLSAGLSFLVTVALGNRDYDVDDDGLIEVGNLAQLDAVRYDLNGDGVVDDASDWQSYYDAFDQSSLMGCPDGCTGYELTASLDFDTNNSGAVAPGDTYWNSGEGWAPIGGEDTSAIGRLLFLSNPFVAIFEGNGHTVSNLFIDTNNVVLVGLFGYASSSIRNMGVIDVDVKGADLAGGLIGFNAGEIRASYVTGRVTGVTNVGGLVGINQSNGEILASYVTGRVTGDSDAGGLVGSNEGAITASYWDKHTSGHTAGSFGEGKTTAELQAPTGSSGIYRSWNLDLDGDHVNDWHFGTARQYPVLSVDTNGVGGATWREFGYQLREGPTLTAAAQPTEVALSWTAVNAAGSSPYSNRAEATPGVGALDFAHFANGAGIISDLVFVNVATHPIRPVLYFYDQEGQPMDPESVVDLTGDLEVTEDGALSIQMEMEPLGELTISTHGQGEVVSGSVQVVSDGPIGGVLRFDLPGIGVAGVGASQPVRDVIFPARRRGGLSTAVAIRNLGEEALGVSCRLMSGGIVLEEAEIPLEANGQEARYIEELFPLADTSDFVGSVRCTALGLFTGVAVELDAGNRIFTTLPVVPVARTGGAGQEAGLSFAHFANGEAIISDLVFVNRSTQPSGPGPTPFHATISPSRPVLYFYDKEGQPIDPESVVDLTGDLEVTEDGALSIQTEMEPLGELTISTHGRGEGVSGSVQVVSDGPIGGVLRFGLTGIGVAGVGASQPVRDAIFPARRLARGISTAAAIRNLGEEALEVSCQLMKDGIVLEEAEIPLEANGQEARYIEELFTGTDTSDFVGSVRCTAPGEGMFTGVAVELDAGSRIFTTLPVVPVQR